MAFFNPDPIVICLIGKHEAASSDTYKIMFDHQICIVDAIASYRNPLRNHIAVSRRIAANQR